MDNSPFLAVPIMASSMARIWSVAVILDSENKIKLLYYRSMDTAGTTVCPGSSDPLYIKLLYKFGHYFLGISVSYALKYYTSQK